MHRRKKFQMLEIYQSLSNKSIIQSQYAACTYYMYINMRQWCVFGITNHFGLKIGCMQLNMTSSNTWRHLMSRRSGDESLKWYQTVPKNIVSSHNHKCPSLNNKYIILYSNFFLKQIHYSIISMPLFNVIHIYNTT